MRRLLAPIDWPDAVAFVGFILVLAFIGNRFGLDAAAAVVGLAMIGVAVLAVLSRGEVPDGSTR